MFVEKSPSEVLLLPKEPCAERLLHAARGHAMIISTQIVTVWVLTLFMAYLAGRRENK